MLGLRRPIVVLEKLKKQKEESDDVVEGIKTNFPKNPPPPGIAYSKNFARFQKYGRFANQDRD